MALLALMTQSRGRFHAANLCVSTCQTVYGFDLLGIPDRHDIGRDANKRTILLVQSYSGLVRLGLVDIIQPPKFCPFCECWARNAGKARSVPVIEEAESVKHGKT